MVIAEIGFLSPFCVAVTDWAIWRLILSVMEVQESKAESPTKPGKYVHHIIYTEVDRAREHVREREVEGREGER